MSAQEPTLFTEPVDTEKPSPENEGLDSRAAALGLLGQILGRKTPLDQALENNSAFKILPGRDKAFCRMMLSTVLRRLGQLDDLIARAEEKPDTEHPPVIRDILRLGAAQILFMNVPDHAAVDTSVRLAAAARMDRRKGFVNGVLRTITRKGREWMARQDEGRLNTPEWLLKSWIADYGLRTAAEIARAHTAEAPLDITVRDESQRSYWAAAFKATQMGTGTLRLVKGGIVTDMDGFREGHWWVQDASAALPALLFGDIKGRSVVDLCAAPGGKTMQLAARGARVTALDRSAGRLKRLEENLARVRLRDKVEVIAADAAVWSPPEAPALILLDAPCSATGTLRRHPDVAYLKTPADIGRLLETQARILDHAFSILAPGGTLLYCVCSLQKDEGERQITRFLEKMPSAYKKPVSPREIGGLEESVTEDGDLRVLPFHQAALGGMDGFFISRIVKTD